MKYFILAGEKSGDLHGSNLIREIKRIDPNAIIKGWGGDLMKNQGAEILIHHTELAIMGLLGVIQNLNKLKGLFSKFGNQISAFEPDTIIFIDYGGFNLKAARIAKIKGVKLEKANFSFVCSDLSHISDYIKQIDTVTFKILKRALPGPYTFILPGNNNLPKEFKKKTTVGIRVPDNAIALEIVRQLGNPIVSTSIHDEDEVLEYSTDPELIFEKWRRWE